MKYRTILFDADGTLLDFSRSEEAALADTLAHFGLPDRPDIRQGYSLANARQWALLEQKKVTRSQLRINRFSDFCQRYAFSCDPAALADFYEDALSRKAFLIDGAEEICQRLSPLCDLYIVTNGFQKIQTRRLEATPLPSYFKACFISEEMGAEKPDPLFFEQAASRIDGFNKKRTLIVGDSLSSDISGGYSFGIDTCWICRTGQIPPVECCPTYTIHTLAELYHIILGGHDNV